MVGEQLKKGRGSGRHRRARHWTAEFEHKRRCGGAAAQSGERVLPPQMGTALGRRIRSQEAM